VIRALSTALGRFVEAHRRATLVAWAVVLTGAAALLPRFRIDPDLASLLPDDRTGASSIVLADGLDPSARDLLVVLRDRDLIADEDRFDATVAALAGLPEVERVAATRAAFRADSGSAPAPLWTLPDARIAALERRMTGDGRRAAVDESLDRLRGDPILGRSVVEADPLGLRWALDGSELGALGERLDVGDDRLVLRGRSAALVKLTARRPPLDQGATARLVESLEVALEGIPHELVGGHAVGHESARRIRGDMVRSSVTSVPLVLLFLVLSLRGIALAHVVLVPVLVAVVGALGFGGALLGPLPVLAVASAAILVGLGVDFALHVVTRLDAERERSEAGHVARAVGGAGPAVLAGGVTSIAAFLAFAATSIDGLARFGALLALGLALALLASLTLVPALCATLRWTGSAESPVVRALEGLAATRSRRRWSAGAVVVVALVSAAVAAAHGVRFDADPAFMRPDDSPAWTATERVAGELGFAPVPLVVLSPASATAVDLHEAGSRILARADVGLVRGGAGAAPEPGRAARVAAFRRATDDWVAGAVADLSSRGLRAERLRPALEIQAEELSRAPTVAEGDVLERDGERWVRTLVHPTQPLTDRTRREALREALECAFPRGSRLVDPYGTGDALAPALAASLGRAVLISGAVVALVVLLATRGARRALVALAPSAVALAVTLGVMALADWPIHPGNLVALPLVIGLGVDDGLHLILRYGERGAAGTALGTTGHAIWRTTATTVLGFGSLAFATTPALVSLGVVVTIGTASAFLATVTLVPAWGRAGARRGFARTG